jgi:hypothetical protein
MVTTMVRKHFWQTGKDHPLNISSTVRRVRTTLLSSASMIGDRNSYELALPPVIAFAI